MPLTTGVGIFCLFCLIYSATSAGITGCKGDDSAEVEGTVVSILFMILSELLLLELLLNAADAVLRSTKMATNDQVVLSKKSVVFLTPITELDDANIEESPPPFEF